MRVRRAWSGTDLGTNWIDKTRENYVPHINPTSIIEVFAQGRVTGDLHLLKKYLLSLSIALVSAHSHGPIVSKISKTGTDLWALNERLSEGVE